MAAQQETWNRVARELSTANTVEESVVAYTELVDLLAAVSPTSPTIPAGQIEPQRAAAHQILSGIGRPELPGVANADLQTAASVITDGTNESNGANGAGVGAAAWEGVDGSIFNIPINLIQDIINIPYNFVSAMNQLGDALLFSGSWLLASSSNVWGSDPADPPKQYAFANLFPFPAFSNALAQQVTGLLAVLFPINSNCNDVGCPDSSQLNAGYAQPARILELLTTGKFYFDPTPVTYPDGVERPAEGLWSFGGAVDWGEEFGHPEWNTIVDPVTGRQMMPWAGTTFEVDLLSPLRDYWVTHLMSDPTSEENRIKIPSLTQISTAVSKLAYGLFVAFSPVFPGSWYCLSLCGDPDPGAPYYWEEYPFATDWPTLINDSIKNLGVWLSDPFGLKPKPPYAPPPFGDTPADELRMMAAQDEEIQEEEATENVDLDLLNAELLQGLPLLGQFLPLEEELEGEKLLPLEEELEGEKLPPVEEELEEEKLLPLEEELEEEKLPPVEEELEEEKLPPVEEELEEEKLEEPKSPSLEEQEQETGAQGDEEPGTVVTGNNPDAKKTNSLPTRATTDGEKGSTLAPGAKKKKSPSGLTTRVQQSVRDQGPDSKDTADGPGAGADKPSNPDSGGTK